MLEPIVTYIKSGGLGGRSSTLEVYDDGMFVAEAAGVTVGSGKLRSDELEALLGLFDDFPSLSAEYRSHSPAPDTCQYEVTYRTSEGMKTVTAYQLASLPPSFREIQSELEDLLRHALKP